MIPPTAPIAPIVPPDNTPIEAAIAEPNMSTVKLVPFWANQALYASVVNEHCGNPLIDMLSL